MKINHSLDDNSVYFTILPGRAGFTDQLNQFSVFYKLGLSLGYVYLHSKFISDREGSEDIYDFLGFNGQFCQSSLTSKHKLYRLMGRNKYRNKESTTWISEVKTILKKIKFWMFNSLFFKEFNFVEVGVDDDMLHNENHDPVAHFQGLVRKMVSQKFIKDHNRKTVVRFYVLDGRMFFLKLAPITSQKIPYFQDKLDLRSTYFKHRNSDPVKSRFSEDRIKLLMHIRLGDTALIETPWHSFVPLWSGRPISPLKEYPDKSSEVFRQTMDVYDFWRFLQKFNTFFEEDNLSSVIFSDGYKTAFKELFRMVDDLKLGNDKFLALKKSVLMYEENNFSIFDDIKSCVRVVGENNEGLRELVHSSFNADVIVVGCNQRMIPKFLATYYDVKMEKPTIIISLYKDRVPDYEIKLDAGKAIVYQVNVSNLDSDDALLSAIEEIKRRAISGNSMM